MNANTSAKRDVKRGVTRWLIREIIGALFVAAILFVSSGDLDWAMAWVLVGVYLVWTGATAWTVIPTNPEMLVERTRPKKDTKSWDLVIVSFVGVAEVARYIVAGLDRRWGWSPQIPLALQLAGVVAAVLA